MVAFLASEDACRRAGGAPWVRDSCWGSPNRSKVLPSRGDLVPTQNYRQAKKQKEQSRKARQLEKQQRRTARLNGSAEAAAPLQEPAIAPGAPTSGRT